MTFRGRPRLVLALALMSGACTGEDPDPAPTPDVRSTAVTRRLAAGIQVELTATVSHVFGPAAFLLVDADLPPEGQLVVSDAPVTVTLTELVTVRGRTAALDRRRLERYGASLPDGVVAVVAVEVRRYLPP
jgi:hypothetical protein